MSSLGQKLLLTAAAAIAMTGAAGAQLLPGVQLPPVNLPPAVGSVPVLGPVVQEVLAQPGAQQAVNPTLNSVSGLPERIAESGAPTLLELRRLRLQQLIRQNRGQLEPDQSGNPVRRGVLVAVDPHPASLQLAARAGFRIIASDANPELGLRTVQFAIPRGMKAREALRRLNRAAPGIQADYDHVYEPAGATLGPLTAGLASSAGSAGGRAIGMIDGGVASHPSLGGASIEQNGFAGNPQPTGHGTAVASLLVGHQGSFRGAARGASLFVADVYGGNRAAGSATSVVKAMSWLAGKRVEVINVSLVGPSNKLVARAVQQLRARGIQVVASVGNDGPAAPPQFPASYPGVIAVTAVDGRGKAIPEAGRAAHLDFAAPGADMAAALPGTGYAKVRGTSFAAPLAASRLLFAGSPARLMAEARPGRGRVGRGIVCGDCRTPPKAVGAR